MGWSTFKTGLHSYTCPVDGDFRGNSVYFPVGRTIYKSGFPNT